jgi:hypothetical protein
LLFFNSKRKNRYFLAKSLLNLVVVFGPGETLQSGRFAAKVSNTFAHRKIFETLLSAGQTI